MNLCRVVGTVVATAHHPAYDGRKLLAVQPVDETGAPAGPSFLAVDTVQAGAGDLVLVNREGNSARQILGSTKLPVRSVITAVVDAVETG